MSQYPMSRTSRSQPVRESNGDTTPAIGELMGLLDDEYTREIIACIRSESKSAREIARACSASRTTVYRRLNRLQAAGLVTTAMEYRTDGHHRETFAAAFDGVTLLLEDEGFEVEITNGRP